MAEDEPASRGYSALFAARQPLDSSQLAIRFSPECNNAKPCSPALQARLDANWQTLLHSNARLFSKPKFRLRRVESLPAQDCQEVVLQLGVTDYQAFLTTNRCQDPVLLQALVEEGARRHGDADALFSHAFGNAALLLTRDGFFVLGRRNHLTSDFPLFWDLPGGHPEPDSVSGGLDAESVCSELFSAVAVELQEELALPSDSLLSTQLAGILAAHASHGKPTAVFLVHTSLTADQVARCFVHANIAHAEFTHLLFASKQVCTSGKGSVHRVVALDAAAPTGTHAAASFGEAADAAAAFGALNLTPSCTFAFRVATELDAKGALQIMQ
jgi:8-oxo-dGTP pyrophosphatase MutT (NUDIX family)